MNTHEGYSKKTLTNTNVLLAGGGDKSLADFLGGIQYVSASAKILIKTAAANASWTDLVTLVTTDENVKQTPKTDNTNRPLMMINGGTSTGTLTSTSIFSTGIYANANTNIITAGGFAKTGSSSSYVLLGDGDHKELSDFSMAGHDHYRILPTRHDTNDPLPKTNGASLTFLFSFFDNDWWNVLNMRSYSDYNYMSAQLLTPAGNPYSDTGYGDMYWRQGRLSTWITKRKILDSLNSLVSGGGSGLGSSITVKIGGTSKTLTIPSTIDWTELTNIPSTFPPSSHTHDYLYSTLVTETLTDLTWAKGIATTSGTNRSFLYNNSGIEWSYLFGFRDEPSYGMVLKFGYNDTYIRILRRNGGTWLSNDWEKISAGYADIAGSISWTNVTNKPETFTPSAHDHLRILYNDTRNVTETPTEVAAFNGILLHFKDKNKSLIPSTGPWTGILYLDAYSDTSGGYPMELGFSMSDLDANRPLYIRTPKAASTWGDWRTILDSGTYTSYTVKKDGTGASGTWSINITGSAGSVAWANVTGRPSDAGNATTPVYWSSNAAVACTSIPWSFISDKPSTFSPSAHDHYRILPTRYDSDAPLPNANDYLTFQFSYFDNDWWNVLNMRSYSDKRYECALLLSPAGNPGSDVGYGDLYWRQGRLAVWIAKRKILDSSNSSVSKSGETLTVKIGGTSYSLTNTNDNTWRPITDTYTGSSSNTSVSQAGTNALYNALLNGYANNAGHADTADSATYADTAGSATSATRCRYVTCPDTRSSMSAPGDYTASTTGVSFDFKLASVTGLNACAGIMTIRPYASNLDWSGGPAHQLAFNGDGRILHRTGTSSWGTFVVVPQCDTSGNLTCTNFYTTSDRNKKTNISSFSEHIRKFQLKDTEKWHYGVIAQEVEEMFRDGEEGNMTVNYNSILSFYIGSLENKVKILEERIKRLENK